jgi:hypothetical protein
LRRSYNLSTYLSQSITHPHIPFTKLHTLLTYLSHALTKQHTQQHIFHTPFTKSSQSLHKSLTIQPTAPFGRGGACAALPTLLTKISQSSHITPIKVTQSPYKAPSKVTRGRSGACAAGSPTRFLTIQSPPNPPVAKIQCVAISVQGHAWPHAALRAAILMVPNFPPVRFPIFWLK